jgi:diguanylate cyclase (GGDEF)-like protein/PAS domain S-box-containing protein
MDAVQGAEAVVLERSRRAGELLGPIRDLLGRLQRSQALGRGDAETALAQLTEASSQALGVARASVWRFSEDGSELVCLDLFAAETHQHSHDAVLHSVDTPHYFDALRQERVIAADDARADSRTSEFAPHYLIDHGITSMLDAPIFLGGALVGVVCHEHVGSARRWQPWEELVAGTFADFAALVLGAAERAEQARALEQYRLHLEDLVAERTRQLQESEHNFRRLFEAAPVALVLVGLTDRAAVGGNAYALELFAASATELAEAAPNDLWVDRADRERLMAAVRARGSVDNFEAQLRTRAGRPFWADVSARIISLDDKPVLLYGIRDVTAQKQTADALRQSGEQLRVLAETDPLTGLPNRRRALEQARLEIERAARYGRPLSLAMLDMDHFKTINDRHGHLVGDVALRLVAATVRRELRAQDHVGRYGGEELIFVFPESPLEAARQVVERVRVAVEALALDGEAGTVPLTLSGGVVQWRKGESVDDAIRRADAALYTAKAGGRNRIIADPRES